MLAEKRHSGQFRRGPGKIPYIEHPRKVVQKLKEWGIEDPVSIATAWGHDLIEDTDVSEKEILDACGPFGPTVLKAICMLSYDKKQWHTKAQWLEHLAKTAPNWILTIKCADRLCNTLDFLFSGDAHKAKAYLSDARPIFQATIYENSKIAKDLQDVASKIQLAQTPLDTTDPLW